MPFQSCWAQLPAKTQQPRDPEWLKEERVANCSSWLLLSKSSAFPCEICFFWLELIPLNKTLFFFFPLIHLNFWQLHFTGQGFVAALLSPVLTVRWFRSDYSIWDNINGCDGSQCQTGIYQMDNSVNIFSSNNGVCSNRITQGNEEKESWNWCWGSCKVLWFRMSRVQL